MKYRPTVVCLFLCAGAIGGVSAANLSVPAPLPGMTGILPATGKQEKPQIAKGGETFLAVWSDTRSALAPHGTMQVGGGPYSGAGLGTMNDIYAARLDQAGNVIDQHSDRRLRGILRSKLSAGLVER